MPKVAANFGGAPLNAAQRIEPARDVELLVETEGHPRRLLAVAQGGVVDDDVRQELVGHGHP